MGYNKTGTTVQLTAKLTPIGRQKFATNINNNLITSFALGDSDANYYALNLLTTGQVPAEAGELGANGSISNSTTNNAGIKSSLIVNGNGMLTKLVDTKASKVTLDSVRNGQVVISGANITQVIVDRRNYNTDSLVNLFYSFGLPITSSDDSLYTGVTFSNGGFSDTALSGLAQNTILVIAINNNTYGECIDGKEINTSLTTSAGTFNIYGTFQNRDTNKKVADANIVETSPVTARIDNNIAMLFCDTILPPNGNTGLTWSTGFGLTKPFSLNQKQLYNLQTNTNTATVADKAVGVAYLDKGFVVITDPTIISAYTVSLASATTVTLDSISTVITQNITCIANRGEFGGSLNSTFGVGDIPRISEVALYDNLGNVIAMAKTDRHISKNINEFLALAIKINL